MSEKKVPTKEEERLARYAAAIEKISAQRNADVIAYVGNLFPPFDQRFAALCSRRRSKRKNAILVLVTPGGTADAAYRIARNLQRTYRTKEGDAKDRGEFTVYVPSYCKSAGTVLALGADHLIMSEQAELGPIDVQLQKVDEVGDWTSGLTAVEALVTLRAQASALFEHQFKALRFGKETRFSTRVASDVATRMTIGLLEPIYAQVDPMRLGEIERFVRISVEYGERLETSNVKEGTVAQLVVGYPSHGFIIDKTEAETLFVKVDPPSVDLELIGREIILEARKVGAFGDEKAVPLMRYENVEMTDDGARTEPSKQVNADRADRKRTSPEPGPGGAGDRDADKAKVSSGVARAASRMAGNGSARKSK